MRWISNFANALLVSPRALKTFKELQTNKLNSRSGNRF